MKASYLTVVAIVCLLFARASTGVADIAPPPGYVEKCAISRVQKEGQSCTTCRGWYGGAGECSKSLEPKGYIFNCRTAGASVWVEIWCKPEGMFGHSAKPQGEQTENSRTPALAVSANPPPEPVPSTPGASGVAEAGREIFKKPSAASKFPPLPGRIPEKSSGVTAARENDPPLERAGQDNQAENQKAGKPAE